MSLKEKKVSMVILRISMGKQINMVFKYDFSFFLSKLKFVYPHTLYTLIRKN